MKTEREKQLDQRLDRIVEKQKQIRKYTPCVLQ